MSKRPDERYREAMARVLAGQPMPDFALPKAPSHAHHEELLAGMSDPEVQVRINLLPDRWRAAALRIGAERIAGRSIEAADVLEVLGTVPVCEFRRALRVALQWAMRRDVGDAGKAA